MKQYREESDLIGCLHIPADCYYGIQTARAIQNFNLLGIPLHHFSRLVRSLAMVKKACAHANHALGVLSVELTEAICHACDLIIADKHHDQFVVDMVQGGAGTSTNMNANEVIANLALEYLGEQKGNYERVNPNNHVNLSQSTNDVYPSALRLALLFSYHDLILEQEALCNALHDKAHEFSNIVKVGRTQLQDAVPISLGREFESFAVTIREDSEIITRTAELFKEVNLGGTAVGTAVNSPYGYKELVVAYLSETSGLKLTSAPHLIEASSDTGAFVTFSGLLRRVAVKTSKICNDLRLLSSGPRAGMGEIILPPVQAGSSIMPGKVNPVIPEAFNQIAYQVIGNDLTVTLAAEGGQLQLNAFEPVIIFNLLQSIRLLTRGFSMLNKRCVQGIKADEERCNALVKGSLIVVTALTPHIGYEKSARVAKYAQEHKLTVYAAALKLGMLDEENLKKILDPKAMLGPTLARFD